jgi:Ankyrin repeats (3 copies)
VVQSLHGRSDWLTACTHTINGISTTLGLWRDTCRVMRDQLGDLQRAIASGDSEEVHRVLESCVNVKELVGEKVLMHMAVMSCQPAIVKALLQAGADPNHDLGGTTPLMLAAAVDSGLKRTDMTVMLLEHGADPNRQNAGGCTVLDNVVRGVAAPLADVLIRYGARCAVEPQSEAEHIVKLYKSKGAGSRNRA